MGYHMTRDQAETLAATNRNYVAKPYADRHGDATNGFKPNPAAWGVWDSASDHWVFFDGE